jgi:hypothetical protein
MSTFSTPILLIIFNRPDLTEQVFTQIRTMRPTKLFIAADGPRNPADLQKCTQARNIISLIDWPCEVKTLFHDKNLGCGLAPAQAITWFFEHAEEGIILEDDCLPNKTFFLFCEKLLQHYHHDTRIFQISGTSYCHQLAQKPLESYAFTQIPTNWGWATWRRAWKHYDFMMNSFPSFTTTHAIQQIFSDTMIQEAWQNTFECTYNQARNNPTAWDGQWTYTIFANHGLCIMPTQNLISNIGFREDATHTITADPWRENIPTEEINTESLIHPTFILPNRELEAKTIDLILDLPNKTMWKHVSWKTKRYLKRTFPQTTTLYRKLLNREP